MVSDYELEKLNKDAQRAGFTSYEEQQSLISKAKEIQGKDSILIQRWSKRDCCKTGLMEIIENKKLVDVADLRTLFPVCHYHINLETARVQPYFEEHFNDKPYVFHENPEFQRGHVWTEEQQISYLEFLAKEPHDPKAKSIILNCPKWHSWVDGDTVDTYLVDGLQRYTALKRFFNNEIPIYGYKYSEYNSASRRIISHISMDIYINSISYKAMLQWYIDLNDGGTVHTKEEIHRVKKLLEKEV